MSNKYTIKVIQQGQTQKIHALSQGAGMSGQALVLKAENGTRYQLTELVTQISPSKLQMKRMGSHLHLALPGGDLDAPDVVIEGFFAVDKASLWGSHETGEWMTYQTTDLTDASAPAEPSGPVQALFGRNNMVELSAPVTTPVGKALSFVETPTGLGTVLLGAVGLAVLAKALDSGDDSPAPTGAEAVLVNYAKDQSSTAPTLKDYSEFGIKAFSSLSNTSSRDDIDASSVLTQLGMSSSAWLAAINSSVVALGSTNLTKEKVQAAVDSYYRILKEADGNPNLDADVYQDGPDHTVIDDPQALDYSNIGVTVGATGKALDLLNDVVGRLGTVAVDSIQELNAMARAAENVMLQAKAATSAISGGPALYATDAEWSAGLATLGVAVSSTAITDVKERIASTADDGTGVATQTLLREKLADIVAANTLRSYAVNASSGAPTLLNYKDAGIKALSNLNQTSATEDISSDGVANAMGGSSNWLLALNAGLDKIDMTAVTRLADIQTKLQAMANSYYRILSEADGVVNATPGGNTDVNGGGDLANDDPTASDYVNIGATVGGTLKALDLLNDFVGFSNKTAVDTVVEIDAAARAAENIMLKAKGLTAGVSGGPALYTTDTDWVKGLTDLGITGITTRNIAAVRQALDDSTDNASGDGSSLNTVQKINDLLKAVIALQALKDYANANNGAGATAPSLITYKDAGVKTLVSLTEGVGAGTADVDAGAVTAAMGSTWLQALNSALDKQLGDATLTLAKLRLMAESYYRILSEADGEVNTTKNTDVNGGGDLANDDPTASDYGNIGAVVGATLKSLALLNDFVGLSAKTAVDTVAEIDAAARAAENIMLRAKGAVMSAAGGPTVYATDDEWVAGLTALGINGVTTSNIAAIKQALDSSTDDLAGDGALLDTVAEVQAQVSLVRLKAYTDDVQPIESKAAPSPTLADWSAIGVKARDSLSDAAATQDLKASNTNLNAINSALDKWASTPHLQDLITAKSTLQGVLDAYARFLAEADGSRTIDVNVHSSAGQDPSLQDYENVMGGAANLSTLTTGVDAKWLDLINDCIGGLSSSAVDTATDIEALIKVAANVMNQAVGTGWSYTTNSEWVTALGSLGITGLSTMSDVQRDTVEASILSINNSAEIDSWSELQGMVNLVRINEYAASNANPAPSFSDYQAFFDYGVAGKTDLPTNNSNYTIAFNDAVNNKPSNSFTAAEVKALVNGYAAILAEANSADLDQQIYDPVAQDYLAVGVGAGLDQQAAVRLMLGDANNNGSIDGAESSSAFANLLTDVVANKAVSNVDSLAELNALAAIVTKIRELEAKPTGNTTYTDITGGLLSTTDLSSLGLSISPLIDSRFSSTVQQNRLNAVYNGIIGAADPTSVDSISELQNLINNTSNIVI
jgi:hypothetical protein